MNNNAKNYDQFFTKDSVALECLEKTISVLEKYKNVDLSNIYFIEPSAGDGAFIRALQNKNLKYYGFDIDVKQPYIINNDFLTQDLSNHININRDEIVIIGNPPFGKRSSLAIKFINTAFKYSNFVSFILPIHFKKYSAQNQINPKAKLIYSMDLDENSFLFEDSEYSVRCCLQIWSLDSTDFDLRISSPPVTKHPDFEMWQYNNTRLAEKYFDKETYNWDFAVPRQGYKDYKIMESDPDKMDRRTQWIFFKAKDTKILKRLKDIDFDMLSKKNTSTPGFGKADVIQEYINLFKL